MLVNVLWVIFAISVVTALIAWFYPRNNNAFSKEGQGEPIQPEYSLLRAPRDEVIEAFERLSETARCELVLGLDDMQNPRSQRILDFAVEDASEAVALAAAYVRAEKKLPLFMKVLEEDLPRDGGSDAGAVAAGAIDEDGHR